MNTSYILPGIAVLLVIITIYIYNRLISLRNMADTTYANIDTLLQKRFDLVPNLVNTVKGYMAHERELLEALTKARTDWINASSMKDNASADERATTSIKNLFAVAENYPELKANQNFLMLQEELVGIENKIAYSRQRFYRTVLAYNTATQKVPSNLIANLFRFKRREFFEVESALVREAPAVDLEGGEDS